MRETPKALNTYKIISKNVKDTTMGNPQEIIYMINTNLQGNLAEHKLMLELVSNGFDVFISTSGKSAVDLVAILDNICFKFQVKSTSTKNKYGSYEVQLKSIRPNRTKNTIRKFNGKVSDILVVYCVQDDVLQYFYSDDLDGRSSLNIKPTSFNENHLDAILRDYTQDIQILDDDIVQTTT